MATVIDVHCSGLNPGRRQLLVIKPQVAQKPLWLYLPPIEYPIDLISETGTTIFHGRT